MSQEDQQARNQGHGTSGNEGVRARNTNCSRQVRISKAIVRSVIVFFFFRFAAYPSGSPVVEGIKGNRLYKLFVDTAGALLGGFLRHVLANPWVIYRTSKSHLTVFICSMFLRYVLILVRPWACRGSVCKQIQRCKDVDACGAMRSHVGGVFECGPAAPELPK